MNFGIPKEIRPGESRVGLSPAAVDALVRAGHHVYVERDAGLGAGFPDKVYETVGAEIVYTPKEAYKRADVVVKVARPTEEEYDRFRTGQTLFSFLQLSVASPDLLMALEQWQITAIAYETIQDSDGHHPVLEPTSQVAGRMAPIIAGQLLASREGGRGILLQGIPGVPPAAVVILGAGILGTSAARSFFGLGAHVTVLDKDTYALQRAEMLFNGQVSTMIANPYNLAKASAFADVLVGAAAVTGQRAPILITRSMVQAMRPRAVILDFAIDSGGCIATSHPTTHSNPTYVEEGVIHYCVPSVPALVSRTASYGLANALLPYLMQIGEEEIDRALERSEALANGINTRHGRLVHPAIAAALGREPDDREIDDREIDNREMEAAP